MSRFRDEEEYNIELTLLTLSWLNMTEYRNSYLYLKDFISGLYICFTILQNSIQAYADLR